MESLKPPTDNLYKFLAIGGLVAVIAAGYLWNKENSETFFRRHNLERNLSDLLIEFHTKFGSEICHADLPGYIETDRNAPSTAYAYQLAFIDDNEGREYEYTHLLLHDAQVRRLCKLPRETEDIEFWANWYDISQGEVVQAAKTEDSFIHRVNKEAQEFRPRFEKAQLIALEIWSIEDGFTRIELITIVTACLGAVITVIGFTLWYFKVQRYQDQLLVFELSKAKTPQSVIPATATAPVPAPPVPVLKSEEKTSHPPSLVEPLLVRAAIEEINEPVTPGKPR